MKHQFVLCLCLTITQFIAAQNAYDNNWILGYNPNDSIGWFGGTLIDFSKGYAHLSFFPIPFDMDEGTAVISNKMGALQLYSNGCRVANAMNQDMVNGDDINPGILHNEWCNTGDDHPYSVHQGMVCLPRPGNDSQYVMFHLSWERETISPYKYFLNRFYYTNIDMHLQNGLGAVTDKNHLLQTDTNFIDNLSAVRHGNGRDWWVLLPKGLSDTMYLYLLTPYGIEGPRIERTGIKTAATMFSAGQVVFSPDGRKYIRAMKQGGIAIFDFDRCTGKFICGKKLAYPGNDDEYLCGAAISASSRYLYISALTQLFQYDLFAEDIEASKVKIGEYDGFVDTFGGQPSFYRLMLAPDRKIYICAPNTVRYLHVIDQPDSAGTVCNFQQRGLKLYTHHGFCLPNFPHFRLYDVQGSPCDTLGIDAPDAYRTLYLSEQRVRFTPNPASGLVLCSLPPCSGSMLRVYDAAGRFLEEHQLSAMREFEMNCTLWPAGLYIVSVVPNDGHKPISGKLVVVR